MSYSEKQILAMLRAGVPVAEVVDAILRGEHMNWKPVKTVRRAA